MYRKCFFKNKGVLSRRFVASGLAAVFSAGMFGSYAGAMEQQEKLKKEIIRQRELGNKEIKVSDLIEGNFLERNDIKKDFHQVVESDNAKKLLAYVYSKSEDIINHVITNKEEFVNLDERYKNIFENIEGKDIKNENVQKLLNFCTYGLILNFYLKRKIHGYYTVESFISTMSTMSTTDIDIFLFDKTKNFFDDTSLHGIFISEKYRNLIFSNYEVDLKEFIPDLKRKDIDISNILENIKKEMKQENIFDNEIIQKIPGKNFDNEIIQGKKIENKTKNKFRKTIIVVSIVSVFIIILVIFLLKNLGKGNSNTGVPNNNKDDEKVNPSTDPENPLTDPESDEQNPEQKKQEQESSVGSVGTANLKAVGASVFLGGGLAGYVTYLVNEVLLKRGKSSEVKNLRNVDDKYIMYLDSDGNKVTKTEESEKTHDNYDTDGESDEGTKQLLEDKDAEEKEEGQEKILVSDALSDDTESNSDEDKNKD